MSSECCRYFFEYLIKIFLNSTRCDLALTLLLLYQLSYLALYTVSVFHIEDLYSHSSFMYVVNCLILCEISSFNVNFTDILLHHFINRSSFV